MLTTQHRAGWNAPTGYAASHCRLCKYGWTRTGSEGGELTVCLLDRGEPALADMTNCDRYELKEPQQPA